MDEASTLEDRVSNYLQYLEERQKALQESQSTLDTLGATFDRLAASQEGSESQLLGLMGQ